MKSYIFSFTTLLVLLTFSTAKAQNRTIYEDVPTDSIRLSDPFVYADKETKTYYMTGTGGLMWKAIT